MNKIYKRKTVLRVGVDAFIFIFLFHYTMNSQAITDNSAERMAFYFLPYPSASENLFN